MGYSTAIYAIKKSREDISLKDFLYIEDYISWKYNKWNFEKGKNGKIPFPTFKSYFERFSERKGKYKGIPNKKDVEFYKKIKDSKKESFILEDELFFWGSVSKDLIEGLLEKISPNKESSRIILDKNNIDEAVKYANEKYGEFELQPVKIKSIFKRKGKKILVEPFDGIEVEFDDERIKRIEKQENLDGEYIEDDEPIWIAKTWIDREHYEMIKSFNEAVCEAKVRIDNGELVYMSFGW